MREYSTEKIRNVAVLGGTGSGKTTLLEAVAFASQLTNRLGSIEDGNTICDYDSEEIKRGFSISLSVMPVEWNECKINFIDTPGSLDFQAERLSAVTAADSAIIIINGKKGIDAGTIQAWNLCEEYELPRIFFVTGIDDNEISYLEIVEELTARFGNRIAPFQMPLYAADRFIGYADITCMKGRKFTGIGKYEDFVISDSNKDNLTKYKTILDEAVASVDDENLEKYFAGEEFTQAEKDIALRTDCIDRNIIPVTIGSGLQVRGIYMLLDIITKYLPCPYKVVSGFNVKNYEIFDCVYDDKDYMVARVFKTISDPYIGKYSLVKILSGTMKQDTMAYNPSYDAEMKISRLYRICGKNVEQTEKLVAGDIGAIPKINCLFTGNTVSTKVMPIKVKQLEFEIPYTIKRIEPEDENQDEKLSQALSKIAEEDPTIEYINDTDNSQRLIKSIGEQQIECLVGVLLDKYKIKTRIEKAKIGYKETICSEVTQRTRYKKQSGGHGQFGEVEMSFMPSGNRNVPYEFETRIFGGAISKNYFSAVEKGIAEAVKKGELAGFPVVGVKAILTDGAEHPVDSSDYAFTQAAIKCFKEAYLKASPIILEPYVKVKIYVPSKYSGDISGDLKIRKARILGMIPQENENSIIEAEVPEANMDGYMAKLRSLTEGYGKFEYEFCRYGQMSDEDAAKLKNN